MKKENSKRKLEFKNKLQKITKKQAKLITAIIETIYIILSVIVVKVIANNYPNIRDDQMGVIICILMIGGIIIFSVIEYIFDIKGKE